jgi:four helix bundle protein
MVKVNSYRELQVWQESIERVELIYRQVNQFPKDELLGLSQQIKRAAVSVPSNIAEGFMRKGTKEFVQFLHISLGSLGELGTQIEISVRLGFVFSPDIIIAKIEVVRKMLYGLINSLKPKL